MDEVREHGKTSPINFNLPLHRNSNTDELRLCTFRFLLLATFDCVLYAFVVFFSRLANPLSSFLNILIMRRQTTNELYLAMIIECVPRREMTFTRHARYRYKIGNEHRRT